MGRRPIGGIFSVGVEESYRWKDSVQSGPEVRTWVAEGTANGMRPWVTKFGGVLYDRRWLPVVEQIYEWHWRHERYLRNEEPLRHVREDVLRRHTARVHVRERLVRLVHRDREQRERDRAQGLVPFAVKLPAELVKRIHDRVGEKSLNELVAELLERGLEK